MAERPIFIPSLDGNKLVEIKNIEFDPLLDKEFVI